MNETQIMIFELGSKGYSCAQILIIGALRIMGEDDEQLVRAMSALAQGVGNSGQICGALTGGLCVLSLYTAKGKDSEQPLKQEALLHEALITWFSEASCAGGANSCDAILGIEDKASSQARAMDTKRCGILLSQVWEQCLRLLQEYGIDPTMPRS